MKPLPICTALAVLLAGGPAVAQGPGTVSGTGSTEIQRQPEYLRVQVELSGKGKDVPEAMARLKARREAALKHLTDLGAIKERIRAGAPVINTQEDDQRLRMEMMLRERLLARGGKVKQESHPAVVVVAAALQADLPLRADTDEDLLIQSHALQEKIRAADLAGLKQPDKGTPQEEEIKEELAGLMRDEFGRRDQPSPGEPAFAYVSPVSDSDYEKALAEAFQKARQQAARLARAAGAELGPLARLGETSGAQDVDTEEMYYRRQMIYNGGTPRPRIDAAEREAVGYQAGKVTLRVGVTVEFGLLPRIGP